MTARHLLCRFQVGPQHLILSSTGWGRRCPPTGIWVWGSGHTHFPGTTGKTVERLPHGFASQASRWVAIGSPELPMGKQVAAFQLPTPQSWKDSAAKSKEANQPKFSSSLRLLYQQGLFRKLFLFAFALQVVCLAATSKHSGTLFLGSRPSTATLLF